MHKKNWSSFSSIDPSWIALGGPWWLEIHSNFQVGVILLRSLEIRSRNFEFMLGLSYEIGLWYCSFHIQAYIICRTKGGFIFDVRMTFEQRETNHRLIMGKEYFEDFGLQPEQALDRAFAFLLSKKVQRQTEGKNRFLLAGHLISFL